MKCIILFALCYLSRATKHRGMPKKLDSSLSEKIVFAYLHQPLRLTCPMEDDSYIDWSRDGESLYMEDGYVMTSTGALKIKSVQKEHEGVYTCEAINGYGVAGENITLVIVDAVETGTPAYPNSANPLYGQVPVLQRRSDLYFGEDVGSEATFHCVATASPPASIYWFKDNIEIKGAKQESANGKTQSTLKVKDLKSSDSGTYKCIARNKLGEDRMDYRLEVREAPKPRIVSLEPPSATIHEGSPIMFWCDVTSRPGLRPHIKWLKKLEPMKSILKTALIDDIPLLRFGSDFYRPLNLSEAMTEHNGIYKSKLIIRNVEKEDSGTYVCVALIDKEYLVQNTSLEVRPLAKSVKSSFFTNMDASLIATVSIPLIIILGAIIVILCYYRGKSEKASSRSDSVYFSKNTQLSGEPSDPQSKTHLLTPDSALTCTVENSTSRSKKVENVAR